MARKLTLLKYMYSYLYNIGLYGGTFHRPMLFEYPEDVKTYQTNHEENFMMGESLKVSLAADVKEKLNHTFYFPQGTWCEIVSLSNQSCFVSPAGGSNVELFVKDDSYLNFHIHLREGHIVSLINVTKDNKLIVNTTDDMSNLLPT